jgi:N-methylhydantoinase A
VSRYRVAIDVGGTFTDFVIQDTQTGKASTNKVLSTSHDQAAGVLTGLTEAVGELGDVGALVHGNTVGLNALLERRGTRVLLITTEGFRDVLRLARGDRHDIFSLKFRRPESLVPITDVETVSERLNVDGSIRTPLDEQDVTRIARRVEDEGIVSVAVCLLHAYANPAHELRVRELLKQQLPALNVSLSHEIAPEWREYERSSTTVINGYIAPQVSKYLSSLIDRLGDQGFNSTLHIMQSSGGVTTAESARQTPVQALLSGPVGGTIGGTRLAEQIGRPNLMCVDMGGTSFDASLVIDGQPVVAGEASLEGLPLLLPLVDIHTIGAGGGSIAWIQAGGLRVGPQSAGSNPGPACYGGGGTQPTVTDANAVLGRIDPAYFLDGGMSLDVEAAGHAVDTVAEPLQMTRLEAATGILAIINAKMADEMRTMTVQQGIDPRSFSLVAFGGAGPMHAVALAEELGINEVVVPWACGAFSAWGMLHTDMRRDLVRSHYRQPHEISLKGLDEVFDELIAQGNELLADDGVPEDRRRFERRVELRYAGQEYTLTVDVTDDVTDEAALIKRFHDAYLVRYGHSTPEAAVESTAARVAAIGINVSSIAIGEGGSTDTAAPERATREVVFDGVQHQAEIVHRNEIVEGVEIHGPAVIQEPTSTTVVHPGWAVTLGPLGALLISRDN